MLRLLLIGQLLLAPAAWAELKVITSTTTLASVARLVGGPSVQVQSIAKGPQDPHYIEAKPSYMVRIRRADLFISVGLDLEIGWLENVLRGARNPNLLPGQKGHLSVGESIEAIEQIKGRVDRSQGDLHPLGNPHYYLDPLRLKKVAQIIAKKLADLDPTGRTGYLQRAKTFDEIIDARIKDWRQRLERSGVTQVLTYHRTLSYFLKRFGLTSIGEIENKPGVPPSAKHVLQLIQKIKAQNVSCLLHESFFETTVAKRMQKETELSIQVVATEVAALKGTEDIIQLIESLVRAVEGCAQASSTKATPKASKK